MKWFRNKGVFILLILLGFGLLLFSIMDVMLDESWANLIFASYALLIFLAIFFIVLKSVKPGVRKETVEEFEKTLKGRLYHFKCTGCGGIFAVKKSKHNNKKPVKMTCPDCGKIGVIPPVPKYVEEEIPEKKSVNVLFKCNSCGEDLTIWAEGADLYPRLRVYSCPYCGEEKTMKRI